MSESVISVLTKNINSQREHGMECSRLEIGIDVYSMLLREMRAIEEYQRCKLNKLPPTILGCEIHLQVT